MQWIKKLKRVTNLTAWRGIFNAWFAFRWFFPFPHGLHFSFQQRGTCLRILFLMKNYSATFITVLNSHLITCISALAWLILRVSFGALCRLKELYTQAVTKYSAKLINKAYFCRLSSSSEISFLSLVSLQSVLGKRLASNHSRIGLRRNKPLVAVNRGCRKMIQNKLCKKLKEYLRKRQWRKWGGARVLRGGWSGRTAGPPPKLIPSPRDKSTKVHNSSSKRA